MLITVLWTVTIVYGSSSGSGSDFWKVMVPGSDFWKVMVPVPVQTLTSYGSGSGSGSISWPYKANFSKNILVNLVFLHSKLFDKENSYKFHQIYCKMWMQKMLNEVNQIHIFISRSGSGTVINCGSGSDFLTSYGSGSGTASQKVIVCTVPVPQHWFHAEE